MFKFKNYSVRRFSPSSVRVLYKFRTARDCSPRNLSMCSKFNDIDAKHKQKSVILPRAGTG
jgi:hypothetical protein